MKRKTIIIVSISTIILLIIIFGFAFLFDPTTFLGEYTNQELEITITPENETSFAIILPIILIDNEEGPIYSNEETTGNFTHSFIETEKGMAHYIEGSGIVTIKYSFHDRYYCEERTSDDGHHLRSEDYFRYQYSTSIDENSVYCKGLNESFENNSISFSMILEADSDYCSGQTTISGTIYLDDIWRQYSVFDDYACE